jgi:hypothetical protein
MTVVGRQSHWVWGIISTIAFVLLLSACGGVVAEEVKATLKEWSVTPEVSQVESGNVRFVVANDGSKPHELVIIRSDLIPDALPVVSGKVDEERVAIIDEIEPFAAGTTERKTFDLEAGKHVLICNIVEQVPGEPVESHYQNGMRTAFIVTD